MKKIKMSLMAVALVLTAGLTYAVGSPETARALDCSPTGLLPSTLDSSIDCPKPQLVFCCVLTDGSAMVIEKRP